MDIRSKIRIKLFELEKEYSVKIIYACESGSRTWGFESKNSDYDVRFIYAHDQDWYLSLNDRRDVIELPIEDDLDINGWDIKKALSLLGKSNPPLLEWFNSPTVYLQEKEAQLIRNLLPKFYSRTAGYHHYFNMAKRNYHSYLQKDMVILKKYLYVLRPIISCLWIESKEQSVPMEFDILVNSEITDTKLKTAIEDLVYKKKAGQELGKGPRIPILDEFISKEVDRLSSIERPTSTACGELEDLNKVFREIISN